MVFMVYGGSGSGKSAFAEEKALSFSPPFYYLATMRIYGEEERKKVERHKRQRRGKGFLTVEKPVRIEEAAGQIEKHSTVLLECMSNLVANEMFGGFRPRKGRETAKTVIQGIKTLALRTDHLVIVTNNVFEEGILYEANVTEYLEALGLVNQFIAGMAQQVTEVVAGIPVTVKGEKLL